MKSQHILHSLLLTIISSHVCAQEFSLEFGNGDAKTVQLDDYELAYIEYGDGDPIFLIHGALGDYRDWQFQIEGLMSEYRLIAPSLRASYPNELSQSPSTPPAETWSDVDDIIETLDRLEVGPVHLVGHSMGGAIAMDVAVRRPDLIRSLVLEEPAGNGGQEAAPPPEFQSVFIGAIDDIMQGNARSGVGAFIDFVSGPGYFDSLSTAEQQFLIQNAATISIGQMPPVVLCSDAMTIRAPILFIAGELSPLRESAVAGCLPPHTSIVIDDASHGVHNDNPVDYNASLRQFIGRL